MDLYDARTALQAGRSIFDLPLRVAFYARVSTDKEEQVRSLASQVGYYTDWIGRNRNWIFVGGYVDEGLSGTSVKKRESFLGMMEDAKQGRFDFIVTKEISRFSRNTLDSIRYTQELLQYGVGVLFQSDNINTLMPDAELRLTIMASIAQEEVRKISERIRFGFRRAIEKGVVLGNGKIWGYDKKDGRLAVNEKEAEIVRMIFDLYAYGSRGMRGIAADLARQGIMNTNGNPFSISTVKGILTNPKYKGYYCGGKSHKYDYRYSGRKYLKESEWILYKDEENVPAIVSEELWEKANAILKKRSGETAAGKVCYHNKYPYSGKIFCSAHQKPYYRTLYKYPSGTREAWQCGEYVKKGRASCPMPVLYTEDMDEILRGYLFSLPVDREKLCGELLAMYQNASLPGRIPEKMEKIKKEISKIEKNQDKLLSLCAEGKMEDDEFVRRNRLLNEEMSELNARLAALAAEEEKTRRLLCPAESLKEAIREQLACAGGFDAGLAGALLDRAAVCPADDKNTVRLSVRFKGDGKARIYEIRKRRGKPSVCTVCENDPPAS